VVRDISWPLPNLAGELADQVSRDNHVLIAELTRLKNPGQRQPVIAAPRPGFNRPGPVDLIRMRSTPGPGSRFDLMLPAMTAAGEPPAGFPAPAQAGQPRGTWTQR
jgi:hypothetical protein